MESVLNAVMFGLIVVIGHQGKQHHHVGGLGASMKEEGSGGEEDDPQFTISLFFEKSNVFILVPIILFFCLAVFLFD